MLALSEETAGLDGIGFLAGTGFFDGIGFFAVTDFLDGRVAEYLVGLGLIIIALIVTNAKRRAEMKMKRAMAIAVCCFGEIVLRKKAAFYVLIILYSLIMRPTLSVFKHIRCLLHRNRIDPIKTCEFATNFTDLLRELSAFLKSPDIT